MWIGLGVVLLIGAWVISIIGGLYLLTYFLSRDDNHPY